VNDETQQLASFRANCLRDSGFICRNLLGWDYDEDEGGKKTNVGTGGVRASGAHQKMVELLDDPDTKFKLLEAPRGSYKSTILQGFIVGRILENPDVRIIYVTRTNDLTLEKSTAIRNALESERVTAVFGHQKGEPWAETRFTVAGRKQTNLQNATFTAWSMESMQTGGRANYVILDDFIDHENVTNAEQIKKAKDAFEYMQPFIAKGGTLIVVGTRWADDDLYSNCEASPLFKHPLGAQLILGAGVEVVRSDSGVLDLKEIESGLTFPHLTLDFLRQKLHGMSSKGEFAKFSCQYLNVVPTGMSSIFRRWMFQPLQWGEDMWKLSGFLVTDTATSKKEEGCYSVVAYVGLDAADNIYLLDCRVGHFEVGEFIHEFFDVLTTWSAKVNHCGEVWENISLATAFQHALLSGAQSRKVRLRTIEINRYTEEKKTARIQRMFTPMSQRQFFVVNTVPKTFDDVDGKRELWNPEGYFDARTKLRQPSGELVDEFLNHKKETAKRDVADAIAMIYEYDRAGGKLRRYCSYRPAKPRITTPLTRERQIAYHEAQYPQASPDSLGGDWWEKTINGLYG